MRNKGLAEVVLLVICIVLVIAILVLTARPTINKAPTISKIDSSLIQSAWIKSDSNRELEKIDTSYIILSNDSMTSSSVLYTVIHVPKEQVETLKIDDSYLAPVDCIWYTYKDRAISEYKTKFKVE